MENPDPFVISGQFISQLSGAVGRVVIDKQYPQVGVLCEDFS
jgi:hypothetical protein